MCLCTWIRICARGKLQVLSKSKFNTRSCLAKCCVTSAATPSHIHWVFSLMALSLFSAAQRRLSKILLFSKLLSAEDGRLAPSTKGAELLLVAAQTHWRCHCPLEGMLRKGRLRYKILPGILETRSWVQLSPRLPQTLHVSRNISEVFGARNVCTIPDTKAMIPWRNSHRLFWEPL